MTVYYFDAKNSWLETACVAYSTVQVAYFIYLLTWVKLALSAEAYTYNFMVSGSMLDKIHEQARRRAIFTVFYAKINASGEKF